jgi:hypothetical protein
VNGIQFDLERHCFLTTDPRIGSFLTSCDIYTEELVTLDVLSEFINYSLITIISPLFYIHPSTPSEICDSEE